ncbi:MAG TPA: hypothetical protein VHO69_12010 [Phototrophicaceae bacterium]|nr:hypothetical protein [Phototrophicaceae bacterium]
MDIQVRFEIDGEPATPEQLADQYEIAEMLEHTGAQVRQQVEKALGALRCAEHDQPAQVIVTGQYVSDVGQMELAYHIDTCCKPFLLRAVHALNH